jgi:Protein of unknown function (DUF1579)
MRSLFVSVLLSVTIGSLIAAHAQQDQYPKIREGMSKLAPLVGKWNAIALFHDDDGSVTENDGTFTIAWALDETYLEYRVELHRKGDPTHHHSFITYVTFNPKTGQYDRTFFYSRSALRVTETGEYDAATHEFRTKCFIPLEDGVNDENVRTITNLKDPNRIVHTHYSRYNNQAVERMDVEFTLTRR